MQKYLRMAALGTLLAGTPTQGLEISDSGGAPCYRTPRGVCVDYALLGPPNVQNEREIRIAVHHEWDKDVYRIRLRNNDSLQTVFNNLLLVLPQASLDTLVQENNLKGNKLPSLAGDRAASLTYTVKVPPGSPVN